MPVSQVLTDALFRTPAFRAPPAGKTADGAGPTFAILNLFSFDTVNGISNARNWKLQ